MQRVARKGHGRKALFHWDSVLLALVLHFFFRSLVEGLLTSGLPRE